LAVKIEEDLGERAHRISAHRALALNTDVAKISERNALAGLRTGYANEGTHLIFAMRADGIAVPQYHC
jgi:hypothetical protein